MLTRSYSNTEVKGEICFHIKIYLSKVFFQKFSCWLRNISLQVTRMRETFNSWNNYFQNLKASEAYYEEGFYFSILSRAWYKRKRSRFKNRTSELRIRDPVGGSGSKPKAVFHLRTQDLFFVPRSWREEKKNHLPNSSAGSKIHQISYTCAIILFLWGLIYYQRFPARITKTPGFVDNFQWFHVQKKITPTMMITK